MQASTEAVTTVNADGLVLGRMASEIAKRLLRGERITIVNAEKALLSGKKQSKVRYAKEFLEVGSPGRGPFHARHPDGIVRKTVRGMLPHRQPKGIQAYKRLRVFIGVPDDLKDKKTETLKNAQAVRSASPHYTVGEFSKELGWNPGE